MFRRLVALAASALLTTALACGSSSNGGSGTGPGLSGSPQRSSTCLAFQDAECDHIADKCKKLTREACDESFQSLFCKSDSGAQACTDAVRASSCSDDTPEPCRGLADVDAAQNACATLFTSLCAAISKCTGQAQADCQTQVEAQVCAGAVGVLPSAGECAAAADTGCKDGKYATPEVCKGIVKTSSQTSVLPIEAPAFGRFDLRDLGRASTFEAVATGVLPRSPIAP